MNKDLALATGLTVDDIRLIVDGFISIRVSVDLDQLTKYKGVIETRILVHSKLLEKK